MAFRPYLILAQNEGTDTFTLRVIVPLDPVQGNQIIVGGILRHDPFATSAVYYEIYVMPGTPITGFWEDSVTDLENPGSNNLVNIEVKLKYHNSHGFPTTQQGEYAVTQFDQAVTSSENEDPEEGPYHSLLKNASDELDLYTLTKIPVDSTPDYETWSSCSAEHCVKHVHDENGSELQVGELGLGSVPTNAKDIEIFITDDTKNKKRKRRKAKTTTALSSNQPFS